MDQERICEKVTTEIINEFRLPRTVCHSFILQRAGWLFAAGFNEGRSERGNWKQIIQCTKEGTPIRTWDSITIAARTLGIERSHISRCAKGRKNYKTAGGFGWKYGYYRI